MTCVLCRKRIECAYTTCVGFICKECWLADDGYRKDAIVAWAIVQAFDAMQRDDFCPTCGHIIEED